MMRFKVRSLLYFACCHFCFITSAHAQKLFYSDSTFNATLRQYEGVTNFFYDFEIDSIDLYGAYDTFRLKLFVVAPVDEHGKISGLVKIFHPDKVLLSEAKYQDGVAHGRVVVYDGAPNDTTGIFNYVNGRKDGMQYYYYKSSQSPLLSVVSGIYHNGKREGPWREVRADGKILYYSFYVNGLKEGIEYDAFDNGQINFYVIYNNGKIIDGIYRYYDGDGNLRSYYVEYKNGVKLVHKW